MTVSIIIPVYNKENYIKNCIDSILNQTYKDFEILIVDDGSTDESLSVCYKIAKTDSRIRVLEKENGGVSSARNYGLEHALGEKISFIDADDTLKPDCLQRQIEVFDDNVDLVMQTSHTIRPNNDIKKFRSLNKDQGLSYLLDLKLPTSVWSYLFSKDAIANERFNESIHFFEDLEFLARIYIRSNKIMTVHHKIYNYGINESSINTQSFSEKHLSATEVGKQLMKNTYINQNKKLLKKVESLETHILVSLLLSISKGVNKKENFPDYIKHLNSFSKEIKKSIFRNPYVKPINRIIVLCSNLNTMGTINLMKLLKRR